MRSTECFEGPNLHLSERLSTKLSFSAGWLLCNEGVWADRTGVHLVCDHVTELQEVGHTYRSCLVKGFASTTVVEYRTAKAWKLGTVGPFVDIIERGAIEDRSRE